MSALTAQPHRAQTGRSRFGFTACNFWSKVTSYKFYTSAFVSFLQPRPRSASTPHTCRGRPSGAGAPGAPPCAGRGAGPGVARPGGGGSGRGSGCVPMAAAAEGAPEAGAQPAKRKGPAPGCRTGPVVAVRGWARGRGAGLGPARRGRGAGRSSRRARGLACACRAGPYSFCHCCPGDRPGSGPATASAGGSRGPRAAFVCESADAADGGRSGLPRWGERCRTAPGRGRTRADCGRNGSEKKAAIAAFRRWGSVVAHMKRIGAAALLFRVGD